VLPEEVGRRDCGIVGDSRDDSCWDGADGHGSISEDGPPYHADEAAASPYPDDDTCDNSDELHQVPPQHAAREAAGDAARVADYAEAAQCADWITARR